MESAIDVRDLPSRLEEALSWAFSGREIIIFDGATPRARLVPMNPSPPLERVAGLHAGAMQPAPDFDSPLSDDYWMGKKE